jgi:hypothetical protein
MIKVTAMQRILCSKCKKHIKEGELYWFGSKNFCLKCYNNNEKKEVS